MRATQTASGAWTVTMEVQARKGVVGEDGTETEVPLYEWVEVGVFGRGEAGEELGKPLVVERRRRRSGAQTVTVPERPVLAGVDPYPLLDWKEQQDDDNVKAVDTGDRGRVVPV